MDPDTTLVFYSCRNSRNKHDATGAFIPEAKAFQKYHGIPDNNMFAIDCVRQKKNARFNKVLELLFAFGTRQKISSLIWFGHGWPNGIQFGFTRKDIPFLVQVLSGVNGEMNRLCEFDLNIVFYCCSMADNDNRNNKGVKIGIATDGGFCDVLRDNMEKREFTGQVIGHLTKGHTDMNPNTIIFYANKNINDNCGGSWLVEPGSLFWKDWKRGMKTNLRFAFPFMTELEIKNLLNNALMVN